MRRCAESVVDELVCLGVELPSVIRRRSAGNCVNGDNITLGARKVWAELSGKTARQLGTPFDAMSMTSGVGASPF